MKILINAVEGGGIWKGQEYEAVNLLETPVCL